MNFNGETGLSSIPQFSGDAKITGRLFLSDGSDGAPSLTYINEPTTGFERSAAGEVSFVTSGAKRVKLSTSGISATSASFTTATIPTIVGDTTFQGGIITGTHPIAVGPIQAGTIMSSSISTGDSLICGSLEVVGTSTMHGILTASSGIISGSLSSGTHSIVSGSITSSGTIAATGNINSASSMNCDGLFSNLVVTGAVTCNGTLSTGTNSMTSGSISATTLSLSAQAAAISFGTNGMTVGSISGATQSLSAQPVLLAFASTSGAINNVTDTPLPIWDSVLYSQGGIALTLGQFFGVPSDGFYDINCQIPFIAGLGDTRSVVIYRNNDTTDRVAVSTLTSNVSEAIIVPCTGRVKLTAGDSLAVLAWQNSGSNLNVGTLGSFQMARFEIIKLF